MAELSHIAELKSDSAKRRERAIQNLTATDLTDAQVIEQLQNIVSGDPVEYAREAARAQLLAAGQTPRASVAPIQVKQEDASKPAIFVIGYFGILIICVCVAIGVIGFLAFSAPQIGNIFSRVTNGLAP
ncbi:MAG: hypothetical protein B6D41_11415 [Chloroflexi bacterium UTCFX4]|jgi:hypothetical protein|nr:MAG: hypothetical protein B6D41_11415 [Chloroflexi bacterium UTCFX4]